MFLHIFLIPDSLILLKYWAPFIKIQEIRWPRPSEREGGKNMDGKMREGVGKKKKKTERVGPC